MRKAIAFSVAAGLAGLSVPSVQASTWNITGAGSWATAGNWNPATVPNAVGAAADFTPTNSANRAVTVDSGAGGFTVGSISLDTGALTFTHSITTGTTGSNLKLNNGGFGVLITAAGTGTGGNTISAPLLFDDNVTANVTNVSATSAAGALNLTAAISGAGGFTKTGDGMVTFGTGTKTYSGATLVSAGRLRLSSAAQPSATSSLTVASGAQLVFAGSGLAYNMSAGNVNLNGIGNADFRGAIRSDITGMTISDPIVLQTDASIVSTGATATLDLLGGISGPGRFEAGTPKGNPLTQGKLTLSTPNTYAGGTRVSSGQLILTGATTNLGTGDVFVDGRTVVPPSSIFANDGVAAGKLFISTGVLNAIADTATLTLTGDDESEGPNDPDGEVGGFISLGAGINETVGGLILNGITQTSLTTYGSTSSAALVQDDRYFQGTGILTLVPEPASLSLLAIGAVSLLARRRRL